MSVKHILINQQSSWWYLWETNSNNNSKPWGPLAKDSHWHEDVACIEDDPDFLMLSSVKTQDRFGTNSTSDCQIHFAILCTSFAEATSCVVGLSTSIGDQRLGRDAIRRWADGRLRTLQESWFTGSEVPPRRLFFFVFQRIIFRWTMISGMGGKRDVTSPTGDLHEIGAWRSAQKLSLVVGMSFLDRLDLECFRRLPCVWFSEVGCLRLVLFLKCVSTVYF